MSDRIKIRACFLEKVHQRGADKSICPSEIARALGGATWRDLMPAVREVGTMLAREGAIVVTQKGQVVDPFQVKGPIRYRINR